MAVSLDTKRASPPVAAFEVVRSALTLTLNLRAPAPWILTLQSTSDKALDLDNLQLEKITAGRELSASYSLQHLLLAGTCMEQISAKQAKKEKQQVPWGTM